MDKRVELKKIILALILILLITSIKIAIPPIGSEAPNLLYLFGIVVSAYYLGFYPSVAAAFLAALCIDFIFNEPHYQLTLNSGATARSVVLLIESLAIVWLVGKERSAKRKIEASEKRLQEANRRITHLMEDVLEKDIGKPRSSKSRGRV